MCLVGDTVSAADLHPEEALRLAELQELEILDSDAEEAFDAIARLASWVAGTPISLVSLVDKERQWFKARHGLEVCETHRDEAFCAHAILDHEHMLEVPDATQDPRFADNPLVTGGPQIRFYAGVPLRGPNSGLPVGTLCVIAAQPQELRDDQRDALRQLARQAEQLLALRQAAMLLRQQNQALNGTMAMRTRFLATISHDVRTPLNGISGAVELLQQESLPPSSQQLLSSIAAASDSLQHLFNDLTDLVRCEVGGIRLDPKAFQLRAVVEDCLQVVAVSAQEKGLVCQTRIAEALPRRLLGDAQRIRQMLVNLLANAVKFTPQGTITVDLSWQAEAQEASIAVIDQGPGMQADELDSIFEPYVQTHPDAAVRAQGSGLGLAIVRQLAKLMDGRITVQSQPEIGSTFTLHLPLPVDDGSDRVQRPQALQRLSGLRCLVVDDDMVNRQVMVAMLQRLGCMAEAVADAQACRQQRRAYDVLIVDQHMPGCSGSSLCQQIRQEEQEQGLSPAQPMVLISGDPEAIPAATAAQAILAKPLRLQQLHATLAKVAQAICP